MFKLDDNLLREVGLGALPAHEKNRMLQHIYETLEMRVGMRLAEGMSDQQLDEFERLMPLETDTLEQRKDKEKQALVWLETNFPNYKQVVADELEKPKNETKTAAPRISAPISQASAPQYQQPYQPQAPAYQHPPAAPNQSAYGTDGAYGAPNQPPQPQAQPPQPP